ncbi:cation:proton antiporter [Compostibacter hankyongensis]|uniref:Cation:proton antiporter n=1 Tax=Compostibacter hankyongensis TaxID=1007089 RepID=A0ABP8FP79_9BACT
MFYGSSALVFVLLTAWWLRGEQSLQPASPQPDAPPWLQFAGSLQSNIAAPLSVLLLQLVIIIGAARILGYLFKKIGQPAVTGEILAGILLGPSFLGACFPAFSGFLFPAASLGNLQLLSRIGLILFMFIIGMELNLKMLKRRAGDTAMISYAGILLSFVLGVGLARYLYPRFVYGAVSFPALALFLGICMSVTAFPVLARIVQERELSRTKTGSLALGSAAVSNIVTWCLLAIMIAFIKAGSLYGAGYTILLAVIYVTAMLKLIRPFLKRLGDIYSNRENFGKPVVAVFFLTLAGSAYISEAIGIHVLFGAFLAGVIMPVNVNFRRIFIEKIEDVALVLLLPLFLLYTGLRTHTGILASGLAWTALTWMLLTAVAGKLLGTALAARFTGQRWRESFMTGTLMNTRGLVELVVLNIGYDLGVLPPALFTLMVIITLITTLMTAPLLALTGRIGRPGKARPIPNEIEEHRKYRILIALGNPEGGRSLLRLAHGFTRKSPHHADITALHLTPVNDIGRFNTVTYERQSFSPLQAESGRLGITVKLLFRPSPDIDRSIPEAANNGNYDLLLIGSGQSIYTGSMLGKILGITSHIINPERWLDSITGREKFFEKIFDERVRQIIRYARVPLGIFINKGFRASNSVFIPFFSGEDHFLLQYAQKLIHNNEARVIILDASGTIRQHTAIKETIRSIEQTAPNHIAFYEDNAIEKELLSRQDLMLVSLESWRKLIGTQSLWLSHIPSVLVIKP